MSINETLKAQLLQTIESAGSAEAIQNNVQTIINGGLDNVLDKASGRIRIKPYRVKGFSLKLSSPLPGVSALAIRCLGCGRVISYPCWHLVMKFAQNEFHYFVCFVGSEKVNLNCKEKR